MTENQTCQEQGHIPVESPMAASVWKTASDGSAKQLSDTKLVITCERCGDVLKGASFKCTDQPYAG